MENDNKSYNNEETFDDIEKKLEYHFNNRNLLIQALTHSSYANEEHSSKEAIESYEKLEFLGDRLFNFIIAQKLDKYDLEVPYLSCIYDILVNEECQNAVNKATINITIINDGKGQNNKTNKSVRADVTEALCCAIYKDSNGKNNGNTVELEKFILNTLFYKDIIEKAVKKLKEKIYSNKNEAQNSKIKLEIIKELINQIK